MGDSVHNLLAIGKAVQLAEAKPLTGLDSVTVSVWLPLDRVLVVMVQVPSSSIVIMPTTTPLSYKRIGKALRRDATIHCDRASSMKPARLMATGQCVELKLACCKACYTKPGGKGLPGCCRRSNRAKLQRSRVRSKSDCAGPCIILHTIKNR